MIELLVVVAVIAIMATIAIPWWLTSLPAATVGGVAREIRSGLNQARMLAVSTRQNVCVQLLANGYRLRVGGCAGAAWVGAGTDGTGAFRPAETVALSGAGSVFTPFGTASQTGAITVREPGGRSQTVTVWPSGRVTIP